MTEELLALMFEKRNERMRAMQQPGKSLGDHKPQPQRVSAEEFFSKMKQPVNTVTAGSA